MTSPPPRNSFNTSEQSSYGRLDSTPDLLAEEGDLGAWRRRKDKGKGRAQDVLPGAEDEEESFPPLQGDVEAQESKRIADTLSRWSAAEKTRRQSLRRTSTLVLPPSPATLIRAASRRTSTRRPPPSAPPPARPLSRFTEDLPTPRSSTSSSAPRSSSSTAPRPSSPSSAGTAGLLAGPRYESHPPISRVPEEDPRNPFADQPIEEEGSYEARTETFELDAQEGASNERDAGREGRRRRREEEEEEGVGWWEWVFCGCFGAERGEGSQEGRTNPNE